MRLCLNDSGLGGPYKTLAEEKFKTIHDIGFRVAGIGLDQRASPDDIARVKDLFAKYDMMPGPAGTGNSPFHPDPAVRKQFQNNLKGMLNAASKIGVPTIRVSGGNMNADDRWWFHPENHTQKALDMMIEATRELIPYAEDAGVVICPETTQFTIINTVRRMKEFVDRCDSPNVRIIFDVVNHTTSESLMETGVLFRKAVAILGDRIGVLHVKDVTAEPGLVAHIVEAPMGTGYLDHASVIEASNELEPWKTFSLEHFSFEGVPKEQQWIGAYRHIMKVSNDIGYAWTGQHCTREKWLAGECK
ncbi:sugar phosphate isomerase/epimerase family protein [Candidatus Latescibacterota bacterium]